jgi:hypothetical protein
MLFRESDTTSAAIRSQVDELNVAARKATGVGFFSTINLAKPLETIIQRQWDWNFVHSNLSHGGSFMCWIAASGVLELEAVVHNGEWPEHFDPNDFTEAK